MISDNNSNLVKSFFTYSFIFIVTWLLSCYINTEMDDLILKDAINKYGNIIEWAKFYSNNWGGRVLSQGVLVLLLQLPDLFFQIINAAMWTLLVAYINKIFNYEKAIIKDCSPIIFFFMMLILIPSSVLRWTVFWKSASVSYLWGTSTALITLWPFVKLSHNNVPTRREWIFAFICCVYASNYEQIAAFLCGGMLVLLLNCYLLRKETITISMLLLASLLLVLSVAFTAYFLMLPGNSARLTSEIIQWYPNYDMYNIWDRAFIGINYAIGESNRRIPFILMALSFLVFGSRLKTPKGNWLILAFSGICFIFYLFNFIHRIGDSFNDTNYMLSRFFALADFEGTDFVISGKRAVAECVNVVMISFLGASLCYTREDSFDVVMFIFYFGGLATMAMMGFSPTIYASGHRSMFICFLFMLCCLFRSTLSVGTEYLQLANLDS